MPANFLYMLTAAPTAVNTKAFDARPHPLAPSASRRSTSTTRVIHLDELRHAPAVAGGVGALKGSTAARARRSMRTLLEIGEVANVDAFTEKALRERRRLMGFGHRVYTAGDPRAAILKGMAEDACRQSGQFKWYEMAVKLYERVNAAKKLIPNVDFYSAPLFYSLGIPVDFFTPVIAAARVAGWTANIIEQTDDNRLTRPAATTRARPAASTSPSRSASPWACGSPSTSAARSRRGRLRRHDGRLDRRQDAPTPLRLVDGIGAGVEKAGSSYASAELFLHGSTIAVNTILERRGPYRARHHRGVPRRLRDRAHQPARFLRPLLPEARAAGRARAALRGPRADAPDGDVLTPLDEAAVEALAARLTRLGIEATAILFLHR